MSGFQSPITIKQALERISSKELLLPSFQREFVWSTEQIENLFDSIMKGYPFSSMLFWKVKDKDKKDYKFSSFIQEYRQFFNTYQKSEDCSQSKDFYTVLDGQQRLTALFIGFRGSYAYKEYKKQWNDDQNSLPERKLYLNLTTQTEEENYCFKFLKKNETNNFEELVLKDKNHWFKVGEVENIKSLRKYNGTEKISLSDKEINHLEKLHQTLGQPIINFYEIDNSNHQEAVDIFIRVNSGGTYLTKSTIMFSMVVATWDNGILNTKEEFKSLRLAISNLGFTIDNDFILKAILFLFHKNIKFDLNSFKEDFLIDIRDNRWSTIKDSIVELFKLLESFRLNDYTLTSSLATLPILYYIYHKNIYNNFYKKESYYEERSGMKKWLFSMLIRQVFGGSSDTILAHARSTFTQSSFIQGKIYFSSKFSQFPAKDIVNNISKISAVDDDFIEKLLTTQKDNKYTFSILSLLYPHLNYSHGKFHKDHLHPLAKYKEQFDRSIYNSILNLQLIDDTDNLSKQDLDLNKWVNDKVDKLKYTREEFLEKQLIPNIDLDLDNFNDFIDTRKVLLTKKLKELLN